ncbi:hypothetical protein CSW30_01990 [Thermus scotoductus]|uniref:Uncharacterized protein n=1 Tax=Thermus scotoductus TaxID=37636 RepID=A0A430UT68_THESC|nr:hypothetical protein [Thermus scotoductus]RTI11799.1 hypothetical protein CSW30_01990 [Thermus scotoductus]
MDRRAWAVLNTSHPRLQELLPKVYTGEPCNVELPLREVKVYAVFSWEVELLPLGVNARNGVLALGVNAGPYTRSYHGAGGASGHPPCGA